MYKKVYIVSGLAILAYVLFKALTFKIGPCSPELELVLNKNA